MNNPSYTTDFFNVLKNQTRLHIFQIIINSSRCTLGKIQQELKNVNIKQSQYSISEEHIQPLITTGLITESTGKYTATLFGVGIHDLLDNFDSFIQKLPPQSECHEETLMQLLLSGPKTCEEIKQVLPTVITSRTIKRLSTTGLINIPTDRNYVFFHKSKRDPALETLTDAETKVYQSIPPEGIAADKLAKLVDLSQRRIYAHIRHLKGKKLVFAKKIPVTYNLTDNGQKLAIILQNLSQKVDDTWNFTEYIAQPTDMTYLTNSIVT
jgi:predicted transcriptional regulator